MIVWRALAACAGFTTTEKPTFWKRLFNDFLMPLCECGDTARYAPFARITDKDRVPCFSRIKLNVSTSADYDVVQTCVSAFTGVNGESIGAEVIRDLQRLASIAGPRCSVQPAVHVSMKLDLHKMEGSKVNGLIRSINQHKGDTQDQIIPSFCLVSIDAIDHCDGAHCTDCASCLEYGRQIETLLEKRELAIDDTTDLVSKQRFSLWLRDALRLNEKISGGIRELCFMHPHRMSAYLSAVPHARSLTTLKTPVGGTKKADAAWLGYALFYPDSSSSTWMNLILSTQDPVTEEFVDMLRLMAKRNNLTVALGIHDPRDAVSAYYRAVLRKQAPIFCKPSRFSPTITFLSQPLALDACLSSTDRGLLPEWILVIVPGYGEAWARDTDIESIEVRQPGTSFVSSLAFVGEDIASFDKVNDDACTAPLMTTTLELIGSSLRSLDLTGRQGGDLEATLQHLAVLCPSLRGLRLDDRDSSVPLHGFELPLTLETLDFSFAKGKLVFADSALCDLHLLRSISVRPSSDCAVDSRRPPSKSDLDTFIYPLLRRLPGLQRFQWMGAEDEGFLHDLEYPMRRFVNRAVLSELVAGREDVAVLPNTEAIVAWLRVARRSAGRNVVGKLNKDVLKNVASFAR